MTDSRAKQLKEQGDRLFSQVLPLRGLQQEIAEHFYPERAQFTAGRTVGVLGADFASHLTTCMPLLARRELGDAFSAMMRPQTDWFHIATDAEEMEGKPEKLWLEDRTKVMRRAMYDHKSGFVRATKGGDHDFAAFGQAVLSADLNRNQNGLSYKQYHLRDVVWREGYDGQINETQRNWSASAADMNKLFKGKVHPKVAECLKSDKDKYKEFNCRHVIIAAEDYEVGKKWRKPWVSVWYDCENDFILEEIERWDPFYIIPRWKMLDGSQYAFSPATVIALPEARTLQVQALTLLEAGEKAVDPPMLGRSEYIRGDVNTFAGAITWADAENDVALSEVLAAVDADRSGLPFGLEMIERTERILSQAFYLNRLTAAPQGGPEKTAYEVAQLVQDYIRNALPLFEPMEGDYNGQICERTFEIMLRAGGFGPLEDIPQGIRGSNTAWRWESPLHQAIEMNKRGQMMEAVESAAVAAKLDPTAPRMIKGKIMLRDVLNARVPQKWLASEEEMEDIAAQGDQEQAVQAALAGAQGVAAVAEQAGKAGKALKEAQE